MALCADPALTYLTNLGYNAVRHPSTKYQPLDVLGRDRGVEWLGPLTRLCTSKDAPPLPTVAKTASVTATRTNALQLGVGIKILTSVLEAFGAQGGALHAAHAGAHFLKFSFTAPRLRFVDAASLGKWLVDATPDTENPVVERYFADDGCVAYVMTEIITSNRITVSALRSSHDELALDIPALQSAVGAQVKVERSASIQGEVVYTGNRWLTFGFKAFALTYSFGRWAIRDIRPGEAFAGPKAEPTHAVPAALGHVFDDGWVDLGSPSEVAEGVS